MEAALALPSWMTYMHSQDEKGTRSWDVAWEREAREEDTEVKWGYLGTPGWVVRVSPWVCVKRSTSC